MTVQAGTELDLDLAALVGEMEAPPCESNGHGLAAAYGHHGGNATHYVKWVEPCGTSVKAYCTTVIKMIESNLPFRCKDCGYVAPAAECATILGPVNQ